MLTIRNERGVEIARPFPPLLSWARITVGTMAEMQQAVEALRRRDDRLDRVTHLIVTSCTGFYAPGLDIDIVRDAGLAPSVQRTLIGFMGMYTLLLLLGLILVLLSRHLKVGQQQQQQPLQHSSSSTAPAAAAAAA